MFKTKKKYGVSWKISEGFKNFRRNMKGLSFSEKMEYLKDYYLKETLLFGVIIGIIVILIVTTYINRHTERILCGATVGVDLSTEGVDYINDKFFELHKTPGKRQKMDFTCLTIDDFNTEQKAEESGNSADVIVAQMENKNLDYLIQDEVGLQYFASFECYSDLRDVLTDEEFKEWKDKIVYVQEEDSDKRVPVGIDISETKFIKDNYRKDEKVFFCFIINSPHKELTYEFFHYILAYK